MTITYDPETKRAIHEESGLAVEFERYGPRAQERDVFFNLIWQEEQIAFKAGYDFGANRIAAKHPGIDSGDILKMLEETNDKVFYVGNMGLDIESIIREYPDFPQIFVETWYRVVAEEETRTRKSVYFEPFFDYGAKTWSVEG